MKKVILANIIHTHTYTYIHIYIHVYNIILTYITYFLHEEFAICIIHTFVCRYKRW